MLFLLISLQSAYGQKQNQNVLVTYNTFSNDINTSKDNPILVIANDSNYFRFMQKEIAVEEATYPYEQTYGDTKTNTTYSFAQLKSDLRLKTKLPEVKRNYTLHEETKNIHGLLAKKATIVVNSNHITIWYTNDLNIKGSPNNIGADLGLVLEYTRNGDSMIKAVKIDRKEKKDYFKLAKFETTPLMDYEEYSLTVFNNKFTTIPVFKEELINHNKEHIGSEGVIRYGEGTTILTKVKFPKITSADQLFLAVKQQSNGDAYDRTGTVFLIPTEKDGKLPENIFERTDDLHNIELMRFFTTFGVNHYNHINFIGKKWQKESFFRQDISEFIALLSEKEWYVGTSIGNYDKGGHKVTIDFTIHPGSSVGEYFDQVIPIFDTGIMQNSPNYKIIKEDKKGLTVEFTLDKPIKNAKLRYVTTGHGGWGGGDEFNQKLNTIYLNRNKVMDFIPWRPDCASYRDFNPASGNFSNGLSSSDLSRSNWCPGTITPPLWVILGDLEAGKHTIQVQIPIGNSEGGSSSSWYLSGTIFGQ